MTKIAVTVQDGRTNAQFTRTMPESQIKAFRQKCEQNGFVIRRSRPVSS